MSEWTDEEQRRFGGLQRLYGMEGAQRIRQAHVVVVGIGGVGSWVAEALARSGVARLTLVDMDHIAESNINRQIHALTSTTGQAKAFEELGPKYLVPYAASLLTLDTLFDPPATAPAASSTTPQASAAQP